MFIDEKCPRAGETAAGGGRIGNASHDTFPPRRWQGLACELHGVRLVDRLPAFCPLRCRSAVAALRLMTDSAWAQLASGEDVDGLALLRRVQVCERCVANALGNPVARRLRRGVAA